MLLPDKIQRHVIHHVRVIASFVAYAPHMHHSLLAVRRIFIVQHVCLLVQVSRHVAYQLLELSSSVNHINADML